MLNLIGRGAYACVFHPDIVTNDPKYVSKVYIDPREMNVEKRIYDSFIHACDEVFVKTFQAFKLYRENANRPSSQSIIDEELFEDVQLLCRKMKDVDVIKGIRMDYIGLPIDSHRFVVDDVRMILENVKRIASVLHDFHEKDIVHRDIKPQNILFDDSNKRFKIIDFGLMCSRDEMFEGLNMIMMNHSYPFYPPEFKLQYTIYLVLDNMELCHQEFSQDNKAAILSALNQPEYIHDIVMLSLVNRDVSNSNVLPIDRHNKEVKAMKEFYTHIVGRFESQAPSALACVDVLKSIFKEFHHLVDVYGLGCSLYSLHQNNSFNDLAVLNLAKRFTAISPIARRHNWLRFLRRSNKNEQTAGSILSSTIKSLPRISMKKQMMSDLFKRVVSEPTPTLADKEMSQQRIKNLNSILKSIAKQDSMPKHG